MKNTDVNQNDDTFLELLNKASIDGIIGLDNEFFIRSWNTAAGMLLSRSEQQVIGKNFIDLFSLAEYDPDLYNAIIRASLDGKSFLPVSHQIGYRQHAEIHVIPLKQNNSNAGVMVLIHDVSHRVRAERELAQLNNELATKVRQLKSTAKELSIITQIAGENIKEPIRKVYTGIENLIKMDAANLTNGSKATLRRIQSSLTKVDLLLDDIMNVAKIPMTGETYVPVDVQFELTSVLKTLRDKIKEKNARIEIGDMCTVNAHEKLLNVLLYHLIDNAIKFNNAEPPIVHIECTEITINEEMSLQVPPGNYKKLTVTDNGIGIAVRDKIQVFDIFAKLHSDTYRGAGIGLTIAQKIMDAHAGFIRIADDKEVGSSLQCFFPS